MNAMTTQEQTKPDDLARRLSEWLDTPEGSAAIRTAMDAAEETCRMLRESRAIDWRLLNRPMTI